MFHGRETLAAEGFSSAGQDGTLLLPSLNYCMDAMSLGTAGLTGILVVWRLSITLRLNRQKDSDKRQEQLERRASEADEAMVAVKGLGLLVFGVDGDRKNSKLG